MSYDPCDWDEMPDHAGLRNWRTGAVISYHEAWELEQKASPEDIARARRERDAAAQMERANIIARHLLDIGKAAGFKDPGHAFLWTDLVDHVLRRLEAAK